MHCHQFHERMNDLLDTRRLPEQDPLLIQHAQDCRDCRSTLETQRQVFQCLSADANRHRRANAPDRLTLGIAAASAAAVLLVVSLNLPDDSALPIEPDGTTEFAITNPATSADPDSQNFLVGLVQGNLSHLLPEQNQLTDAAWLESVSGGVKPLANSMSSTFNVLRRTWPSAGPRDQASETSPEAGTG